MSVCVIWLADLCACLADVQLHGTRCKAASCIPCLRRFGSNTLHVENSIDLGATFYCCVESMNCGDVNASGVHEDADSAFRQRSKLRPAPLVTDFPKAEFDISTPRNTGAKSEASKHFIGTPTATGILNAFLDCDLDTGEDFGPPLEPDYDAINDCLQGKHRHADGSSPSLSSASTASTRFDPNDAGDERSPGVGEEEEYEDDFEPAHLSQRYPSFPALALFASKDKPEAAAFLGIPQDSLVAPGQVTRSKLEQRKPTCPKSPELAVIALQRGDSKYNPPICAESRRPLVSRAMSAAAELEHFIGYGGKHLGTVCYHPSEAETLIYVAASAIIVENVNDPHKQEFLRGHDAEVSALDVSLNGKLLASGQLGSPSRKGAVAPVVVWDFDNRSRYIDFHGLAHSVLCVKFSPDGRFLVAAGANQMLYVWDVSTGEVVYNRRTESPCFLGVWGPILETGRYPSYQLCTTYDSQVLYHLMSFDMRSMSYSLGSDAMQFPPSGLQRKHICGLVVADFLITGTSAGDVCVFSLKTKVFRTALPICNNGVTGIAQYGDFLFVAGGDGRVKAVRGFDTHWDVLAENVLEAGVTALTPSADGAELIAGTRNGKMWRLLSSDLTATLQSASHTGEVTDISFGAKSDVVCTTSDTGEVFLLDLSDYMPVTSALAKSPVRSAVIASNGEILAGYDDGFLRAWSAEKGSSRLLWQVNCHRQGVTVVRESSNFIVTGGGDSAVRRRLTSRLLAAKLQGTAFVGLSKITASQ
ncbi:CFAP52 [Symbiodinium microadriaticum]|nr:CFAP52 [Symbiodinium microadriaticum]